MQSNTFHGHTRAEGILVNASLYEDAGKNTENHKVDRQVDHRPDDDCRDQTHCNRCVSRSRPQVNSPDADGQADIHENQLRSGNGFTCRQSNKRQQHTKKQKQSNGLFRVLHLAVITLAVALTGCGGGATPVTPEYVESTFATSSDGGTYHFGDFSIDLPARAGRPTSSITLRQYRSQLNNSPEHLNFGASYEVQFSKSVLEDETTFTIEVQGTVRSTGDFLIAQRSSRGTLAFQQFTQSTSNGRIVFTFQRENIVKALDAADAPGQTVSLTFSIAERKPFYESSRGFGSAKLLYLQNGRLEEYLTPNGLANQRVAVISHGLNNNASSMLDTHDDVVLQMYSLLDPRNYDIIVFFDYKDTSEGIKENGRRLSEKLISVGASQAKQIDFHGHSMGGLVSRWAIEKEAVGNYVTRLFCYGTPHKGVPTDILLAVAWGYFVVEGYRDLYDNSLFIQALNRDDSPHKSRIPYYLIAGTSDLYYFNTKLPAPLDKFHVGALSTSYYSNLGKLQGDQNYYFPHDGIVSFRSALPADISRFGLVGANSTSMLNRNHSDIANGSEVRGAVQQMLRASGSGVIR